MPIGEAGSALLAPLAKWLGAFKIGGRVVSTAESTQDVIAKIFNPKDPGVKELVDAIQARLPGSIRQVEIKVYGQGGQEMTDFDLVTGTHVIQVKTGTGQKIGNQLARTQDLTDLKVVGFDANKLIGSTQTFKPSVVNYANQLGFTIFNDVDALVNEMKQIMEQNNARFNFNH